MFTTEKQHPVGEIVDQVHETSAFLKGCMHLAGEKKIQFYLFTNRCTSE
jgi:hypothetical protein